MYQVVSELVKHGGKTTRSVHIKHTLRLALCIACCLGGMGTFSSYAAGPNENNPALEQRIQEILEQLATQQRLIQTQEEQIKAHNTALGAYDQSLKTFEASVQANKDAITDITKDGGKLDKAVKDVNASIDQLNTMLDATGQGMQRLQDNQNANSGAIAKLKTSVADITKDGGVVDKNKKAIAKNAENIQANKDQIGKNKEEIGKNTTAISKNAQALDALNGPDGTIAGIKKDIKKNSDDLANAKTELGDKINTTKSDLESKITTDIGTAKSELEDKLKKAQEEIGKTNQALEGRVTSS